MMHGVRVTKYGGPNGLSWEQLGDPIDDASVIVQINSRLVNPIDIWTRQGLLKGVSSARSIPLVLGWDFAGEILRGTGQWKSGQRVFGMIPWIADPKGRGSYVERIAADPEWLARLPKGVTFSQGAMLGLNGQTAAQAVQSLRLSAGESVVVVGAGGAVGAYAVQLAVQLGAYVTGVAAAYDAEHVRSLGATVVLSPQDFASRVSESGSGLWQAFDGAVVAAESPTDVASSLRPGGRLVSTGNITNPERFPLVTQVALRASVSPTIAESLAELTERGLLSGRIAKHMALADAALAHDVFEQGGLRGKIVLAS